MTINYINGREETFEFFKEEYDPNQGKNIFDAINSSQLILNYDNKAVFIPFEHIEFIEIEPAPLKLPEIAFRGIRIISG